MGQNYIIQREIMNRSGLGEQQMLKQQIKLKQLMISQYYKYLTLLRVTNNFEKHLNIYSRINLHEYSGQIAVIGRVKQIAMNNDKKQQYCYPIIQTTVSKSNFEMDVPINRRTNTTITRKFIISLNNYKKLIVPFNKVVTTCKKVKDQLFIFTHIKLLLKDKNQLFYGLTDQSFIIQLDHTFYNEIFKHLEGSLLTTYSDLNLSDLYLNNFNKGSTFVVQQIRNKIHENINDFPILGVLKEIMWSTMAKAVNAKQKEVTLDIIQDAFPYKFKYMGLCRIYLRFDILDEKDICNYLKQGCVYLFLITEIILSDTVMLKLKTNNWRKNFIKITQNPIKMSTSQQIFKQMDISSFYHFTKPSIFRNYYKFNTIKYDIKLLYAKTVCQKCQNGIYRSTKFQYKCRNTCGQVKGQVRLWAIVGAMDESCYAQLNLEDKIALQYFDVSEEQEIIFKDEVAKEEQSDGKTGLTLYFKKNKDEFNDDDPNQIITHERNQFLGAFVESCLIRVIKKVIIGQGRININENIHSFDEQTKHQVLTSFAKSKQFHKKAKIFMNGILRTFEGRGRLIPYIKVECIVG